MSLCNICIDINMLCFVIGVYAESKKDAEGKPASSI